MLDQPVRARLDPDGRQVVDVVIDRGYHPDAIVARAWIPLRLVFRRQDGDICTERVVFSSPHIDRRLTATGTTTIELPAQPPGEVRFTCGMGRYRGRIELIPERASSILTRLRSRDSRLETPVRTALVLWICSLPLIALLAVLALDVTAAIAVAGAALIACVAGCLWASGRSSEPI
jgi:plastocyanin domain-containing protein